jgi:hypothetical protein
MCVCVQVRLAVTTYAIYKWRKTVTRLDLYLLTAYISQPFCMNTFHSETSKEFWKSLP